MPNYLRKALRAGLGVLCLAAVSVAAKTEQVAEGVYVVRDEDGAWGGASMGMTHQNNPGYLAKKVLDLSEVPEAIWREAKEARLSVYFALRDYSWNKLGKTNGLDETFEFSVNGTTHRYPTSGGAPVYGEKSPKPLAWYDIAVAKEELHRGKNEFVFQKGRTTKPQSDDYLYLGIDTVAKGGNSFGSVDGGKTWSAAKLNTLNARGEYMVRLYLITQTLAAEARWRAGSTPALHDPGRIIAYAGARKLAATSAGLPLQPGGTELRIEWERDRLDGQQPIKVMVETAEAGSFSYRWLKGGAKLEPLAKAAGPQAQLLAASAAGGLEIRAGQKLVNVRALSVSGSLSYHPQVTAVDIRPDLAPPAGTEAKRPPQCRVESDAVRLENASLRCRFEHKGTLRLVSLFNEFSQTDLVRQPDKVDLFLIEAGANRYSGTRDFACRAVRALGKDGFAAELVSDALGLGATLTGTIAAEGLRLGLAITNRGKAPVDFKLAFPHLAGLSLANEPAQDYYFFPHGGGIINHSAAWLRSGYGDHQALYQVIDLFSPSLGAGLSLRIDDAEGRYKVLALRKAVPGQAEAVSLAPPVQLRADMGWSNSLAPIRGTSLACEYLKRTRGAGGAFVPAPVVIAAHAGDWHGVMRDYAAWAHRVWQFRPWPSRLDTVATMLAAGWGKSVLFKDGQYRTDILKPERDCLELMSWWDWSPLGPWRTPFEQVPKVIGAEAAKRWQAYFVKDPVTGQTMWNNQPGDYDGYNERFGGLPAFRKAIETYQASGALVTLYTDPIRCDDNTKLGQAHGKDWGVVRDNGEYVKSYEVWNMCHDVAAYRQWVADAMARVLRETGADGIRLDEYGHRGWACWNQKHAHTFAEPGCTEWQRAIAETCKLVHAGMDRVNPKAVLTTEHPGYDYLMQYLEGCITYDLTVMATPLRPLECNVQRFYFPECKAYELDHRGADPDLHKRFWNLVAAFGKEYPPAMYAILKENRDAHASTNCEPLVPTLQKGVYANRFGGGPKTLWTVYNNTGHTLDAPLLEVELKSNEHLVELLGGEELGQGTGQPQAVQLWLPAKGVACVARLPRLIEAARNADTVQVKVHAAGQLFVCNADGQKLAEVALANGAGALDLKDAALKGARCLKLLREGTLLDLAGLP